MAGLPRYYGLGDYLENTYNPTKRKTGFLGGVAGSLGNVANRAGEAVLSAFGDRRNDTANSPGEVLGQSFRDNAGFTPPAKPLGLDAPPRATASVPAAPSARLGIASLAASPADQEPAAPPQSAAVPPARRLGITNIATRLPTVPTLKVNDKLSFDNYPGIADIKPQPALAAPSGQSQPDATIMAGKTVKPIYYSQHPGATGVAGQLGFQPGEQVTVLDGSQRRYLGPARATTFDPATGKMDVVEEPGTADTFSTTMEQAKGIADIQGTQMKSALDKAAAETAKDIGQASYYSNRNTTDLEQERIRGKKAIAVAKIAAGQTGDTVQGIGGKGLPPLLKMSVASYQKLRDNRDRYLSSEHSVWQKSAIDMPANSEYQPAPFTPSQVVTDLDQRLTAMRKGIIQQHGYDPDTGVYVGKGGVAGIQQQDPKTNKPARPFDPKNYMR